MEQRYFFTKVHYKTSLQNIKTFKADSTCERFLALFRHNIVLFNENHNNEVHVKIDGNHGGGSFKMSVHLSIILSRSMLINAQIQQIWIGLEKFLMKSGSSMMQYKCNYFTTLMLRQRLYVRCIPVDYWSYKLNLL